MSNIAITGTSQRQLGGCETTRDCPGEPPAPNPCPASPLPAPEQRLWCPQMPCTRYHHPGHSSPLAASLLAVGGLKRRPRILIISHNCAVNLISIMVFHFTR